MPTTDRCGRSTSAVLPGLVGSSHLGRKHVPRPGVASAEPAGWSREACHHCSLRGQLFTGGPGSPFAFVFVMSEVSATYIDVSTETTASSLVGQCR